MKIAKLGTADISGLLATLRAHPELWDQNTSRTENPDSPHHGLSDIWARYASPGVDGSKPHSSIWYESPITDSLKVLARKLVEEVNGTELGGVLITRIPPGAECRPHTDPGWHARYYEKVAVQVASAEGQAFMFHGEHLDTKPGDIFWFDNAHEHWVPNPTEHERITAIFCIKSSAFDALKETPCLGV